MSAIEAQSEYLSEAQRSELGIARLRCNVSAHQYDQAEATAEELEATVARLPVLERPIPNIDYDLARALLYLQTGKYEDATGALESVQTAILNSEAAIPADRILQHDLTAARITYKRHRRLPEAATQFREVIAKADTRDLEIIRADGFLGIGRVLDLAGLYELACRVLNPALKLYCGTDHRKGQSNVYDLLGRIATRSESPHLAWEYLTNAERLLSPEARVDRLLIKYHRAVSWSAQGVYSAADELAEKVLKQFRDVPKSCGSRFGARTASTHAMISHFVGRDSKPWVKHLRYFLKEIEKGDKAHLLGEFASSYVKGKRLREDEHFVSTAWQELFLLVPPSMMDDPIEQMTASYELAEVAPPPRETLEAVISGNPLALDGPEGQQYREGLEDIVSEGIQPIHVNPCKYLERRGMRALVEVAPPDSDSKTPVDAHYKQLEISAEQLERFDIEEGEPFHYVLEKVFGEKVWRIEPIDFVDEGIPEARFPDGDPQEFDTLVDKVRSDGWDPIGS